MTSFAKEQNFYFVAKATPEGVYLRWDSIDGNFPDNTNVSAFVLKRNASTIATLNPHTLMSISQIQALYQKPEKQNSLKKVISNIAQNADPNCQGANLGNFAQKIQGCMQNTMWNKLASKLDFNIASIGHRAYLDISAGDATVEYELLAMNEQNVSQRLGKITLDPSSHAKSILGARNFKQVYQLDENVSCLSVEYAKDDYTVSLSWENGGSKTDAFANSMMLAGYDLYRSTKDTIDLTTLSQTAAVDANGDYVFADLEKVNAVPILLANSEGKESTLYLETSDELKKAGLKPEDTRFYYLVARDFTGHYGPTVITQITVPNKLPPVTPWGVRTIESVDGVTQTSKVQLVWDHVNVKNYVKHYKNTRKFCNTNTFNVNERLRFVDNGVLCGNSEIAVNLNVDKYYIYRFDSPLKASRFSDDDLDGIADIEESPENRCKKSTPQGSTLLKVLQSSDFDKEEFVKFTDSTADKAKYYWYRIAAVSASGISSILTMPIRVMIPDRTLPKKSEAEMKTCISRYVITPKVFYEASNFRGYIANDKTGKAKQIRVSFNLGNEVFYLPIEEDGRVQIDDVRCSYTGGEIEFLDEDTNVLASHPLGTNGSSKTCEENFITYTLIHTNKTCTQKDYFGDNNKTKKVNPGEDLFSLPTIILDAPLNADECIEFSLNVGSKRHKIVRRCDGKQIYEVEDFNLTNLGQGEKYCIGMTVYNANNQHSSTKYLPCFAKVDEKKPNKANILSMELEGNTLSFSWILPQEKIASTIISIYNEHNGADGYLRTYPHPGHMEKGNEILKELNVSSQGKIKPKWCAKAKSIGFNGKSSAWSTVRCAETEEDIERLAWPKIPNVKKEEDNLTFHYIKTTNLVLQQLQTQLAEETNIIFEASSLLDSDLNEFTLENIKKQLRVSFSTTTLQFMFYRQEKIDNAWSKFIQISPLVQTLDGLRVIDKGSAKNPYIVFALDNNLRIVFIGSSGSNIALLYYIDNYPYKANTSYKYVQVHFDKDYEISKYSISNEVRTGGTQ